jgi:hypothetical protein
MATEESYMLMEIYMMVNGRTIRHKEMVNIPNLMELNIMENGWRISRMDME